MRKVAERLGGRRLGEEMGVFNKKAKKRSCLGLQSCLAMVLSISELHEKGMVIQELY